MIKYLLYPLSCIYDYISILNKKKTKSKKLYCPVISVGNITWGGSGKTPLTIEIAKYILSLGKTPVILTRGYKRKDNKIKNVVVRDKEKILVDVYISGDEPYMMANSVNCPIIVGSNRFESANIAKKFNPDIFILDDGFQHWKLQRDLDIVCLNSLNPFGNGFIIPAGILREKKENLKRANIVVLTNANYATEDQLDSIKKEVLKYTDNPIVKLDLSFDNIVNMKTNLQESLDFLKTKNIHVLCAIGTPTNFKNSIENLGLKISKEYIFTDHHKYSKKDLVDIYNQLSQEDIVITTAKDSVKIRNIVNDDIKNKIYVLNVSVKEYQNILKQEINKLLEKEN